MTAPAGLKSLPGLLVQVPNPAFWTLGLARLRAVYAEAFEHEVRERRLSLWLPVCAGAGAIVHQVAAREPSLGLLAGLDAAIVAACLLLRRHVVAFRVLVAVAAVLLGMTSSAVRTARLDAPVLDRIRVVKVTGFIEEMDHRRAGARFVLRLTGAEGLEAGQRPLRVRLTTPRPTSLEAGTHVRLTARLVPPSRAALPGGYDFARDAFHARLGAVGNALGRIEPAPTDVSPDLSLRFHAAVDRVRNALALRVEAAIGGPAGAIGAAMVTGKRDFLDDPTREVIKQAGIFHIITIAGVQMTLVAAIFFSGFRRLLALSPTLALHYPIKKWAAGLAMIGAVFYDIATGSRVGTERALYMTLIILVAVVFDRRAISMRNLALATLMIVLFEPEALLGAGFQLSFAAVAGLLAVWEVRLAAFAEARRREDMPLRPVMVDRHDRLLAFIERTRHGPAAMLMSTVCATAATTSFMAYNFHEFSPYVLIGNPLTLAIIEFFAVPGALLGTILYPLGLDGWVWTYVGWGIHLVMWAASWLAALPGATLHLREFRPGAIVFLSLAVLCAVLWRSLAFRLLSLPLVAIGVVLAASAPMQDLLIAPTGDALALRGPDGRLGVVGRRPSGFMVEQWLRADGDGRRAPDATLALARPVRGIEPMGAGEGQGAGQGAGQGDRQIATRCDGLGCVGRLPTGEIVALTLERAAFAEDCARADILVTPLYAPDGCAARHVIDRERLGQTGALTLRMTAEGPVWRPARALGEDRPWSPAPRAAPRRFPYERQPLNELPVDETPPFR